MLTFSKSSYNILRLASCFVFFMCGTPFKIHAQSFYSADPNYLKFKTEGNNVLKNVQAHYPDTSITLFHNFFPRNFLGNTGLSSAPYFLKYGTQDAGFHFFDAPTQNDRLSEEDVKYYKTKGPYADLTGIAGSKQLQIFKLNFTHTFKERMNVTLRLNRYNSTGYYRKQQTFANNILFNTSYISKKGGWGYYAYFLGNLNKNRENGGLKDSILNDSTVWLNKGILDVKLDSAARENREAKVMLNPWIRLNRKKENPGKTQHILELKSQFLTNKYRYKDQSISKDKYYDVFYYDTLRTLDSAHVQKINNTLAYDFFSVKGNGLFAGYRNEFNRVWQKTDSTFTNNIITAGGVFRKAIPLKDSLPGSLFHFESLLNVDYVFSGPNQGNQKIESRNSLSKEGTGPAFDLNLLYDVRNADHIYRNWKSNHFYWQNNFKPVQSIQAQLKMRLNKRLSAGVLFQNINNQVYFDEQAQARQASGAISNLTCNFMYSDLYFKHIGLHLNYVYQQTSSEKIIRLPKNSATVNLFFYAALFKNNMLLQIGGQAQVYQSFESYAFMPATQVYYVQNGFRTGNYPFLDVYLNVRIRPASFFVKLENVLAGYAGSNFALVQGYYQPQMALRFGLTWMFFD